MKKVIFAGFLIFLTTFCYSNDGGYELVGDSLHPINIIDVSLDYERLIFLRRNGYWEIEVYIELNNQTNSILEPLIGFEFHYQYGPLNDFSLNMFDNYILLVNGEPQQFKLTVNWNVDSNCVLLYSPILRPGINKVYHKYTLYEGYESAEGFVSYILETGSRWKNRIIKEIEIFIKADSPGMLRTYKNSFSEFDIIGEGKIFSGYFSTDDQNQDEPHYSYDKTYSLSNGYLYKRLENYTPTKNIRFNFFGFEYRGYSARPALPGDLTPYIYTTGQPPAPLLSYKYIYYWERAYKYDNEYDGEKIREMFENNLKTLSAESKRILRNTIYAMHGYVFNDTGLREYFSNQYWYYPNRNLKLENIQLSAEANRILQFIVQSER